jgi:serine/threonine-protein kinase RsbW
MIYRFKTRCAKNNLRSIRSFVEGTLQKHGLSEIEISTIVLAVDEVCANLIIHSHGCDESQELRLAIDVKGDRIQFDIIDKSEIFNINEYKAPDIDDIIKAGRKGGIGLILVKKIMDKIEFLTGKQHYICRLTKKLPSNS